MSSLRAGDSGQMPILLSLIAHSFKSNVYIRQSYDFYKSQIFYFYRIYYVEEVLSVFFLMNQIPFFKQNFIEVLYILSR